MTIWLGTAFGDSLPSYPATMATLALLSVSIETIQSKRRKEKRQLKRRRQLPQCKFINTICRVEIRQSSLYEVVLRPSNNVVIAQTHHRDVSIAQDHLTPHKSIAQKHCTSAVQAIAKGHRKSPLRKGTRRAPQKEIAQGYCRRQCISTS